ncbi:MAG: hypothetical protein WD042_10335 [Phycisphaeraceae bacterium]
MARHDADAPAGDRQSRAASARESAVQRPSDRADTSEPRGVSPRIGGVTTLDTAGLRRAALIPATLLPTPP